MNIGIDIDGVIFDSENYLKTYAHVYAMEQGNFTEFEKDTFSIQERHGFGEDDFRSFMNAYGNECERIVPFMPFAKEAMNKLKEMGHRLIIISARGWLGDEEINCSLGRFEESQIPYDKIYFRQFDKVETCKAEKIDYMIDDNPNHIKALNEAGIKTLHFKDVYGEFVENELNTIVFNWADIYRFFLEISKNDK